jgi:peptide/nickel transport system substrate-binding protein
MPCGAITRRELVRFAGSAALAMAIPARATALGADTTPGTLVIATAGAAGTLDPALATTAASYDLVMVVYERLVAYDDEGQPQPQLAESWETLDDLTHVFTLRAGVTFHNGQPLTADDVKWTFERIKDPATASSWARKFEPIDAIDSDGDRVVTFHLSSPYGPFMAALASPWGSIVPSTSEPLDLATTMVGTGAFMLEELSDEEAMLARAPAYWQPDLPILDQLTWRTIQMEADRLAGIRDGKLELATLADPASVEAARTSDSVLVLEQETTDIHLLGLNCAQAPFDDENVRQALSRAIDRQAIVDTVFASKGQVTGPIAPTMGDWAQPVHQLPYYSVDREEARALLEEAGKMDVAFTILVAESHRELAGMAEAIRDQLGEIGVSAGIESLDQAAFDTRVQEREFEAFVDVGTSGNDPDSALYPTCYTGGPLNVYQFSDEEVDKLLDDGRNTADHETRKAIYQNLEVALADASPAIFVGTRVAWFATLDTVGGFRPSASQSWDTLKETSDS